MAARSSRKRIVVVGGSAAGAGVETISIRREPDRLEKIRLMEGGITARPFAQER